MKITRVQFNEAMDALWSEIQYQNELPRRTPDSEAKDVPGFATLGRRYLNKLEIDWADNDGDEPALHTMRKLAAIFIRGMIYRGVKFR